ncbi:MAG: UDP-N-acetylmuramate dehydrogenase [Candidatus Kerfeldbacteria bacterium]|nr:UDP-N-acetylmuramate dehydrogenase [Candidatus Kerfeldbacteria bacterium]
MSEHLNLRRQVLLGPYTTLKIGGPANVLFEARSTAEAIAAQHWSDENNLRLTVLGAGSNTLVADRGFVGTIIIARHDGLDWQPPRVVAEAGVKLGQLMAGALAHRLGGLAWLVGVPGTVGGAIYGNAGSRTEGLGYLVDWVETLEPDGSVRRWLPAECGFSYRTSVFKSLRTIILRAQLKLPVVYPTAERMELRRAAAAKSAHQPTIDSSAGCIFKNPVVGSKQLPDGLQPYHFPDGTISAWRLVAAVGLQGFQLGQVQISPRHANFMVNLGGARADQVVQLISLVKQRVRDTLGIQLQEEVQYLGFDDPDHYQR